MYLKTAYRGASALRLFPRAFQGLVPGLFTQLACTSIRPLSTSLQWYASDSRIGVKRSKITKPAAQASLRHLPRNPSDIDDAPIQQEPELPLDGGLQSCTTASTCEQYDLGIAVDQLHAMGVRSAQILLPGEMAHARFPFGTAKVADVLVLANGTVVSWGMTELEVAEHLIPALRPAEVRAYSWTETEDMDYIEEVDEIGTSSELPTNAQAVSSAKAPDSQSGMIGDVIYIRGATPASRLLAKAAFSSGLARNTKLACLEISLDKYITSIKSLSDALASGQKIGLRGPEVLKITGQLLQIRGHLNLYSELIETPDLYWSEPQLESLYSLISRKLDVSPRIAILNKRLDYASELVGILKTHISEEQSTRLEWMIIILITVEVCFEIVHFVEKYWH